MSGPHAGVPAGVHAGAPGAVISSRHNPRFRAALDLRDARRRRAAGRLLIDGIREIGRALDAGLPVMEAWLDPARLGDGPGAALLPRLRSAGAEMIVAVPELLEALAYGDRTEGIVVLAEEPSTELARLADLEPLTAAAAGAAGAAVAVPLVAVVEGVEKPGNLGAVLRSADGAGVTAVIAADMRCDPWNANAIRASLGTIFRVPLAVCSSAEAIDFLRERGFAMAAARVDGAIDYGAADLRGPLAIVLGAEDTGLSATWQGEDVTAVRIPMLGIADSLNVSVSAAILFYEALRQRRGAGHG